MSFNKFLVRTLQFYFFVDSPTNHDYKIHIKPLNESTLLLIAVLFVGSIMFAKGACLVVCGSF